MKKIAYVGVDYHINQISVAIVVEGEKDFLQTIHLRNDDRVIHKYLKKLSKEYDLKVCYEASNSGYVFQRKLKAWGYDCDVIAPSLVPKKPGDRRKNDFRDARELASNYQAGRLTVVNPPNEEQEGVRSLIRCRWSLKESAKNVKRYINSFLLARGHHWKKKTWTAGHRKWLSQMRFSDSPLQTVLDEQLSHLNFLEGRIAYLESQIEEIGASEIYAESVKKLRAFKGLGTLSAMLLIAEITDFRRFASARQLMAFLGLIPSEDSSGEMRKGGPITKAGNRRCRTQLIESVQHYSKKAIVTPVMKKNLAEVDASSAQIATKCMHRLHKRYWALIMKGKVRHVALTAIAREFVGFIWAMMKSEPICEAA